MTLVRQPVEGVGAPRQQASAGPGWRRRLPQLVGAAVLAVLLAVIVGAYLARTPPAPRPASRPATEFSAERAFGHVEQIAAVPHPIGSAANARVRDYLIAELRHLGLQPNVQAATAVRGNELARVENIHARVPGRASTGHIVLAAHYDSVAHAPGAADDAAGVAAILETARALRAAPPLRNDIDLLITDGEEPILLGAQAFVNAGVIDPSRSIVLNLEAGGSSGPSMLFQSSPGNKGLIQAFAQVGDPVGGSELAALFELLPNDTDFTVFSEAGFPGLNLIFGDGHVQYHSPTDSPANLDRSSLQHHGDNLLRLAQVFGEQQLPLPRGEDVIFFSLFGTVVWYPEGLTVPLALLAFGVFAGSLWYARRHGARLWGVAIASATVPLLLAAAAGLGAAVWWALGRLRPAYQSLDWGSTYRPQWYEAGIAVLAVTAAAAWYFLVRRRLSSLETMLGLLVWLVGSAVAMALLSPEVAYVAIWPAIAGSAGLAAGLRLSGDGFRWAAVGGTTAAFVAGALWWLDCTPDLALAAAPMTMVALLAATAMPAAELLLAGRVVAVPAIGTLLALLLLAVGFRIDVLDAEHPGQTSLAYVIDTHQGSATWLSADPVLAPWTQQYISHQRTNVGDQFPGPLARARHAGPAPVWPVPPPEVTVTRAQQGGGRRVILLHITAGGARRLDVAAATAGHRVTATVDDLAVEGAPPKPPSGRWNWGLIFEAVPPGGIDVTLTIQGADPLPLRVLAYHDGLPPLPQLASLPEDLTWSRRLPNATVVATSHQV
jgi:Peptidase family M28